MLRFTPHKHSQQLTAPATLAGNFKITFDSVSLQSAVEFLVLGLSIISTIHLTHNSQTGCLIKTEKLNPTSWKAGLKLVIVYILIKV